jgi:hypothetical protein
MAQRARPAGIAKSAPRSVAWATLWRPSRYLAGTA